MLMNMERGFFMKQILFFLCILSVLLVRPALMEAEESFSHMIPEGWSILSRFGEKEMVVGDLTGDGIGDVVLVLERVGEEGDTSKERSLLIAFGDKGGYQLHALVPDAILKAHEGGIFGDPFVGLSIEEEVFNLSFYGGSNWRWYSTFSFQYLKNDLYLTEVVTGSFHVSTSIYNQETYYDLWTGEYRREYKDGKGQRQKEEKVLETQDLLPISNFVVYKAMEKYLY